MQDSWSQYVSLPALRNELHFGRVVRCFTDRPQTVDASLRAAAKARPEAEALVCGDRRLTYAEFEDLTSRVAGGLAARGVAPGDRIAILLSNSIEFVVLVYAAARLGAVSVPLNVREQRPELLHVLSDCTPRLVVYEDQFAANVPQGEVEGDFLGLSLQTPQPLEPLLGPPTAEQSVEAEDLASILYTSGTTGRPKGAMLHHINIIHSVRHFQLLMQLTNAERSVIAVPMSHVTGLVALIHTVIASGGALVIMPAFKAADFIKLAARERITHTVIVPAMFNLCLLQPDLASADLSSWRVSGYGGAVMPEATLERIAARLPHLQLVNCYGATETTSPAVMMPPKHATARRDMVGLPTPCAEIIVMTDGREAGPGELGEIWIRGPMVVSGYWRNPEATAREFVDGYWRSGDLGYRDEAGFIKIVDRLKDVINRGGYKIYAAEVESILLQDENVLEVAVVATPCPVLGERVAAFVVAKPGCGVSEADLTALARAQLSDFKVPERWQISESPLPRNANGKVVKTQLRSLLAS